MGTTLDKLNSVRNDLRLPSNYPYLEEIAEAAGTTVAALSRHIDDWIADYRRNGPSGQVFGEVPQPERTLSLFDRKPRSDIEEAARLAGLPVHNIAEELIQRGDR